MARIHGQSGRVYVDQYNLSGRANQIQLDLDIDTPETTAFEDVEKTYLSGRPGWQLDVNAFADYVVTANGGNAIDSIIFALAGGSTLAGVYFDGSAAGSHGYEGTGVLLRDSRNAAAADAQKMAFSVRGQALGGIGRAMKLNEATVVTGTGALTGQQFQTAPAGWSVFLVARVIAVTGSGSITVRLEESSDNAVGDPYATVATAAAQTALGARRASAVAGGTLGAWYRCNVSAYSGFTDVTLRTAVAMIPPRA